MFFPSPQLRTVWFQLAALVVRCRDVCTIWRGPREPLPLPARGVWTIAFAWVSVDSVDSVDSECVRLV